MGSESQGSLFEESASKKYSTDDQIVTTFQTKEKEGESAADLKLRRDFISRIKSIAKLKHIIEEKLPKIFISLNHLFQKHIKEVEDQLLDRKFAYLEKLDLAYQKKSWTRTEREDIKSIIVQMIDELTQAGREVPKKYGEYIKVDLSVMDDIDKSMFSSMFERMSGVEGVDLEDILGDEKLSPEEFFEKYKQSFSEGMDEKMNQEKPQGRSDIQKDIQKIYKGLAKKIHPDLEQDEGKRNEKEQLMKQLTSAKDENDLFNLLMIQAKVNEYEGTEQELSKETIRAYSKELLKEKKKLELEEFKLKNGNDFNSWLYKNFYFPGEKKRERQMKAYRQELEEELSEIEEAVIAVEKVQTFKRYLKEERENQPYDDFDFFF